MADGFEEIEAITIIDVLRRAGAEVIVAGVENRALVGSRKIKLVPDVSLDQIKHDEFDMIVLPGGQAGVDNLRKNATVLGLLQRLHEEKKWIGAICAAPLVLRDAGLIRELKLTSYPGFEKELQGADYAQDRVVTDGRFITSRGPGTAMEFALKIVEVLYDRQKADELSETMLAKAK